MAQSWLLLLTYVGGALSISFLCSILEATLLSTRVAELSGRAASGDRGASVLLQLKQDRLEDAISAILTLNTIAHTIGSALAGAQATVVFGDAWLGAFSAALTLLVLIFTEIIPKTLGTVHASRLAGPVGHITQLLTRLLAPLLVATRFLTGLIAKEREPTVSRVELSALVAMARRDGALARDEFRVFQNVLQLDEITVGDVMTPRTVVAMLPATLPASDLLKQPVATSFSRIPLFGENRDDVQSYIIQREVLQSLASGCDGQSPLSTFARPVWYVPETTPIGTALRQFLTRREQIAVVPDEFGAIAGIIALEDLVETVLGAEIVDESDSVPDMRALATKLRDERMRRRQLMEPEIQGNV